MMEGQTWVLKPFCFFFVRDGKLHSFCEVGATKHSNKVKHLLGIRSVFTVYFWKSVNICAPGGQSVKHLGPSWVAQLPNVIHQPQKVSLATNVTQILNPIKPEYCQPI